MESVKSAINFLIRQLCLGYFATLRVKISDPNQELVEGERYALGNRIYAHYERDTLGLVPMLSWSPFVALVDQGRDGDWAANMLQPLGLVAVRGSSLHDGRRAAFALRRVLLDRPIPSVVCVDGPAGPAGIAKSGILRLARSVGRPVAPAAMAASRSLVVSSRWSKMAVPLPFSKLVLAIEEVIVPDEGRGPELESLRELLDERLTRAARRAERILLAWREGTTIR